MKLKLILLLLCVTVVFAETSCNRNYKDLIVGGWQEEPGSIASYTFLFYSDGTFETYIVGSRFPKARGTYFIDGSKLYLEIYDNGNVEKDIICAKIKKLTETKLIFSGKEKDVHYKKM